MNTEDSPMKALTAKIDALIKANLTLHVARSSPAVGVHRAQFAARPEADVARCQAELTATLNAIFYPPA
jgi:hypothetical protein